MFRKWDRKSIRIKDYDYSSNGFYFITINSYKGYMIFGDFIDGEIILNEAGKIAEKYWLEIPKYYPKVTLHNFVVMPNHIHGIIEIKNSYKEEFEKNRFQKVVSGSIGAIVRGYKTGVTKWFRKNSDIYNVWHKNYYDILIRDDEMFIKISNYIEDNPKNWEKETLVDPMDFIKEDFFY